MRFVSDTLPPNLIRCIFLNTNVDRDSIVCHLHYPASSIFTAGCSHLLMQDIQKKDEKKKSERKGGGGGGGEESDDSLCENETHFYNR